MTGREFGEALERAVEARVRNNGYVLHDGMEIRLADLRAALASKDAGPLADGLSSPGAPGSGGSAGGLAKRVHVVSPGHNWGSQMWSVVQDDGGLFCLTFYADSPEGGRARATAELITRAVNALPQDVGEPRG